MKNNYLYTFLFVITFGVFGYSQEEALEKAADKIEGFAYIDAQEILLKVAQDGYRSQDLFEKLGDSYYYNADYVNANLWYSELMRDYSDKVAAEYYFRYAQSLKSLKQYKSSDAMMDKFYALKGTDTRAQRYQEEPEYLRAINFQSGRYQVVNLKINSSYSDFGPSFYGDELLFASARDTGVVAKHIHQWNEQSFLDLYKVKFSKKNQEVSSIDKFDRRINTKFHESTPVFTNDLKTVYFTRNNFNKGNYRLSKDRVNNLKIYTSRVNEKGRWSTAQSINLNNDEYSVAHPALSPDNKKLYFASDMPGGFGQSDLYVATIAEDGTLGEPTNLGATINTEGKESFPFISRSGDLYFASNGHIGLGGLDLYVASIDEAGNIGEIINLGEPANTPQDDFAFIVNEDSKTGYFSSNREGGIGGDDIYTFRQLEPVKEDCEIVLAGTVIGKDSKQIVPNTQVTLFDSDNVVVKTMRVGEQANFSFVVECGKNYFLRGEKPEYNTVEKLVTTPSESEAMNVELELEKTIKVAKLGGDLGKTLGLNPIYFDFDKSNIRYDASVELAKVVAVMKQYPKMKIEVGSHTDSRGNDKYNDLLSGRRAESTVRYIISKGIKADRISGKGYGESQPVNKCTNGEACEENEYQLNRRSEFIIL